MDQKLRSNGDSDWTERRPPFESEEAGGQEGLPCREVCRAVPVCHDGHCAARIESPILKVLSFLAESPDEHVVNVLDGRRPAVDACRASVFYVRADHHTICDGDRSSLAISRNELGQGEVASSSRLVDQKLGPSPRILGLA